LLIDDMLFKTNRILSCSRLPGFKSSLNKVHLSDFPWPQLISYQTVGLD
jgi:hypothetical protein